MNNCNYIVNKVLATEDHVYLSPIEKESFCFKLAFLVKEEIRKHRWIEGEKHRHLEWEEAKNEWMKLYYEDFLKHLKNSLKPTKKKNISDRLVSYNRRNPVVTGGSV
jgi:hypothetical protein